ncbi:MAG TPA: hypothetical protein VGC18_15930 [Lacisediminihabitans sp.]
MTLSKDNRKKREPQTHGQKVLMWCIFGVAAVLAIIAIVLLIVSGAPLF